MNCQGQSSLLEGTQSPRILPHHSHSWDDCLDCWDFARDLDRESLLGGLHVHGDIGSRIVGPKSTGLRLVQQRAAHAESVLGVGVRKVTTVVTGKRKEEEEAAASSAEACTGTPSSAAANGAGDGGSCSKSVRFSAKMRVRYIPLKARHAQGKGGVGSHNQPRHQPQNPAPQRTPKRQQASSSTTKQHQQRGKDKRRFHAQLEWGALHRRVLPHRSSRSLEELPKEEEPLLTLERGSASMPDFFSSTSSAFRDKDGHRCEGEVRSADRTLGSRALAARLRFEPDCEEQEQEEEETKEAGVPEEEDEEEEEEGEVAVTAADPSPSSVPAAAAATCSEQLFRQSSGKMSTEFMQYRDFIACLSLAASASSSLSSSSFSTSCSSSSRSLSLMASSASSLSSSSPQEALTEEESCCPAPVATIEKTLQPQTQKQPTTPSIALTNKRLDNTSVSTKTMNPSQRLELLQVELGRIRARRVATINTNMCVRRAAKGA